jgi:hypothetical protein
MWSEVKTLLQASKEECSFADTTDNGGNRGTSWILPRYRTRCDMNMWAGGSFRVKEKANTRSHSKSKFFDLRKDNRFSR